MADATYDFIIVGGGSAGCALANRLSADASNRVLVLEAGRMDSKWDIFIHMPAALTWPIGSRFYDWKYESEPEPHMNGRKVYHARGKVLGGSSSINGMIFQRGNPLDIERWAHDPGMESWDYAHCLPYFKKMETCLAGADEYRGGDGPLQLERGPATNPLFKAFFEATQQAGYTLTSDVNGYRQEGFAPFDRNIRRGRRLSAARAYLHPVLEPPEPRAADARAGHARALRGHARRRRRVPRRQGPAQAGARSRGHPLRRLDQHAAAARALGRRRCRGAPGSSASTSCTTCPASARTCRTTSRSTSSTRASSRSRSRPAMRYRNRPERVPEVAAPAQRAGRHEPLRGRRLRALQRRRDLPEPDVPLPAGRSALRRLLAGRRPRLPGAHRPDVLRRARIGAHQVARPVREARAALQLPLDRPGQARVGRGDRRGAQDPHAARVRALQRRRALPRAERVDARRRSSTGCGRTPRPRCTRRAPARWAPARMRSSTRRPCACTASTACASWTRRSSRT